MPNFFSEVDLVNHGFIARAGDHGIFAEDKNNVPIPSVQTVLNPDDFPVEGRGLF